MDKDTQLEQFRETWKEELKQRKQTKFVQTHLKTVVTQNKSQPESPGTSKSNVNSRSYFNENVESCEETTESKGQLGRAKLAEYYPFSIVEGLLNDSGNETVRNGNKRKKIDRNVSYCANVVKQQKTDRGTKSSSKKMKFSNFKNLFTNLWKKHNETEPEQCLLDKLIADIVS